MRLSLVIPTYKKRHAMVLKNCYQTEIELVKSDQHYCLVIGDGGLYNPP